MSSVEKIVGELVRDVYRGMPQEHELGVINAVNLLAVEFPNFRPEKDAYSAVLSAGRQISFGKKEGGRGIPLFGIRVKRSRWDDSVFLLRFDYKRDITRLLESWGVALDDRDVASVWDEFRNSDEASFRLSELAVDVSRLRDFIKKFKRVAPDVLASRIGWLGELSSPLSGSGKSDVVPPVVDDLCDLLGDGKERGTEAMRLVAARIGQGDFRRDVMARWGGACAVTGVDISAVLRASHIKPWRDSSDAERLSADNGLPLIATLDALFDGFLISFDEEGLMLVSDLIAPELKVDLGIADGAKLRNGVSRGQACFIDYHRERFFKLQIK